MSVQTNSVSDDRQRWLTRRSFLHKSTTAAFAAVVAPQIVPSSVLGMGGATSPNNRTTVGFIGTGDHGVNWNLGPYLQHKDAQVVAACDVDGNHLFRATETINDHYKNEDCISDEGFPRDSRPQGH